MTEKNADVMSLGYEEAIRELELTINQLESSQLTLEEAMASYERGQMLASRCAALLDEADLRVRLVSEEESEA
jgi:exodeoxyribonuclease VII small subunit